MFKKSFLAFSFMALSGAALSAPVANLKVQGSIAPPKCTVNGSDYADLLYQFGKVTLDDIPQDTTYNGLPMLANKLTVTCDAETFLTFKATDNYPNAFIQTPGMNSNYSASTFSLVDSTDTTKTVGGIAFTMQDPKVDGNTAYISRANDGYNDNGTFSLATTLIKHATNGWTKTQQRYVEPSALDLLSGKVFEATIVNNTSVYTGVSHTYLHSKSMLANDGIDITGGLDYVGQAILTFSFGV